VVGATGDSEHISIFDYTSTLLSVRVNLTLSGCALESLGPYWRKKKIFSPLFLNDCSQT
jgi:hypothetical protein